MSSFLMSDASMTAIVLYGVELCVVRPEDAEEMAHQFKFDNLMALHKRYGDARPVLDQVSMTWRPIEAPMNPSCVAKMIRLWNYQCAEAPFTGDTPADDCVERIEAQHKQRHGYDIHELGTDFVSDIVDIEEAIAHTSGGKRAVA